MRKLTKKERNEQFRDKQMFGGNREKALNRDSWTCQHCGMSQEEHMYKWKRSLTVDHIDGQGRYSKVKNHSLDNLITLCLSCHGKKDIYRRKEKLFPPNSPIFEMFRKKLKAWRKNKGWTQAQLGEHLGLSSRHICRLEKGWVNVSQPKLKWFEKKLGIKLKEKE